MKTRLALLLPLLALAACADNNASVRLAQICLPPDDPKTCSFASTCDAEFIGQNTLDVDLTKYVWMAVQADNQRPDNKNLDVSRLNTSTAWGQEIEVEYMGANLP